MAGKPNDKWLETMIKKHGSLEAVKEHQRALGTKGGATKTTKPKGFASMTPEQRSAAGRKGGRNRWQSKQEPKGLMAKLRSLYGQA